MAEKKPTVKSVTLGDVKAAETATGIKSQPAPSRSGTEDVKQLDREIKELDRKEKTASSKDLDKRAKEADKLDKTQNPGR